MSVGVYAESVATAEASLAGPFGADDGPGSRVGRFHRYWQERCQALGRPPTRRELDPLAFPYALSWLVVAEYHRQEHRVRCRLAGDSVLSLLGWPRVRGRWLEDIFSTDHVADSTDLVRRALDGGAPTMGRRVVQFPNRGPVTVLRGVFPLSAVPGEPEAVVAILQNVRPILEPLPDDLAEPVLEDVEQA